MATCENDRIVFIHVPKTGGTWVTRAMRAAGVELEKVGSVHHVPLNEIDVGTRLAFGFVREPLSWYGSVWNFRHERRTDQRGPLDEWVYRPFPDFILKVMRNRPGFLSRYYARFVGPPTSPVVVGKFEQLTDDLALILRSAGQEFDEQALRAFPPQNETGPAPLCPPDLRRELVRSELEAYERFYPEEVSAATAL
jgi:Sulfotransferase family